MTSFLYHHPIGLDMKDVLVIVDTICHDIFCNTSWRPHDREWYTYLGIEHFGKNLKMWALIWRYLMWRKTAQNLLFLWQKEISSCQNRIGEGTKRAVYLPEAWDDCWWNDMETILLFMWHVVFFQQISAFPQLPTVPWLASLKQFSNESPGPATSMAPHPKNAEFEWCYPWG